MHVFALMVYLGYGEGRTLISEGMYFMRIDVCNRVASEMVKRYSSHGIHLDDRVVAYCIVEELPIDSKATIY